MISEYPVIKEYGRAVPFPDSAVQPDGSLTYKVLFDITKSAGKPDVVNPGLNRVARFLNLMGFEGIMPESMELAAVIHGPATPVTLGDGAFGAKYGTANPNSKLIGELRAAGVKLYVCGQALVENEFKPEWVHKDIKVVTAALVIVAAFQLKGYAYQPFF